MSKLQLIPEENLPKLKNLLQKQKELEGKLAIVKADLDRFKEILIQRMEAAGIEQSIKTQGYNFSIVKTNRYLIDKEWAIDEIDVAKLDVKDFLVIDEKKFLDHFPDSPAVKKIQKSKYMRIVKAARCK